MSFLCVCLAGGMFYSLCYLCSCNVLFERFMTVLWWLHSASSAGAAEFDFFVSSWGWLLLVLRHSLVPSSAWRNKTYTSFGLHGVNASL